MGAKSPLTLKKASVPLCASLFSGCRRGWDQRRDQVSSRLKGDDREPTRAWAQHALASSPDSLISVGRQVRRRERQLRTFRFGFRCGKRRVDDNSETKIEDPGS